MWSNVIGYYVEYHKKVQFDKAYEDSRKVQERMRPGDLNLRGLGNVESDLKSLTKWSTWTGTLVYLAVFFLLFALERREKEIRRERRRKERERRQGAGRRKEGITDC